MTMPPCPQLRDYTVAVLAALRRDRDWYRGAVHCIEAGGGRVCRTDWDGTAWTVLDWRTGEILATGAGHDAYDAAWDPAWTDTGWLDRLLEDWYDGRRYAAGWPDGIPLPPPPAPEPALHLPGVPAPLAVLLGEVISGWACRHDPADPGHSADVAALTGLTAAQVAACTASHYQLDGATFTALAAAPEPQRPGYNQDRGTDMPRYLIRLTQENARRLEAMLGGRIEIVPSEGPLDGLTGKRAVVSGLDAITDEEYGPIGRRLSSGGPLYHAGGPGGPKRDDDNPAQRDREEGKCPDGRECANHCGRTQRACSRRCQVCQRLASTDSTPCPACPDAPGRTGT